MLSNPSMRCDRLDDVNTYCRSRGADGLAFVLQNEDPAALVSFICSVLFSIVIYYFYHSFVSFLLLSLCVYVSLSL